MQTQVAVGSAMCLHHFWAGATFRMRLLTVLEPCTSLLGGMWSPTTLPVRWPQWWHPSLPERPEQRHSASPAGSAHQEQTSVEPQVCLTLGHARKPGAC